MLDTVAVTTPIRRLSNCCIFCPTNIFIWQIWLLLAQSVNSNNKDIVTLDIINPETENKHKTPNQNQKYLNSKPTKILRTQ